MFLAILGFLGLIVFGIMSFVSLIRKSGKARRNFIITGVCFLVFIVGVVNSSESNKKEEAKNENKTVEVDKKQEDKKGDEKKEEDKKEEKNETKNIDEKMKEEYKDIEKTTFKDGNLQVEKDVTSFWDETSILKHDVLTMFETLPTAFEEQKVNSVTVILHTEMIDNKGNTQMEPIIEYEYSRSSFEELNYDKFLYMATSETWRILNESDAYSIHPGIYKNVKDDYKNNLHHSMTKIKE